MREKIWRKGILHVHVNKKYLTKKYKKKKQRKLIKKNFKIIYGSNAKGFVFHAWFDKK